MKRTTLDKLLSSLGLAMTALLIAAGALMTWASSFVAGQVHDQLAGQKFTMPVGAAIEDPLSKPYLQEFAGQEMTTGSQAKAYADHYILVHMNKAGAGRTYEEVSGEFIAMSSDPAADKDKLAELGRLRQTLFMGNTLRGLLLNAYAFGTMATILGIGAIVSFVGAAVMPLLSLLGLRHARTASTPAAPVGTREPVTS
ncbi:MAG TPA: hypothetical protein VHM65_05040 [Candidatus Lustribacter sp.]|nr:hypothetical protein [Candidatus Lustribacter sp.]